MADSLDSGSSAHYGRAGSSPASRTKKERHPHGCLSFLEQHFCYAKVVACGRVTEREWGNPSKVPPSHSPFLAVGGSADNKTCGQSQKETPSVRMVFSFWNVAGRREHAASTGAERVKSRGPAGLLRKALPFVGCRQRVEPRDEDIAARTLEYMTAMETAPQPEASGLEGDYRILADFNGTVLAGTHSKHGIQFVTWDRDYDRTDVALRWRNTGAAEKWDRKKQSFRRNPFLASFDYFIFRQRCVIL